jgi:tape measure domain-containing protein
MAYSASPGAVISFSVEGVAASQRQIDNMARSMSNLSSTVQNAMRNLAATAGLGGGLVEVVALSDQYTKLTAQLRLATDSTRGYAAAYADVKRIAAEAQSDLAGTGVLYARIANGTRELGISQQRVADITEVVNLSLKTSGATAQESASAQLQLSQAFAAGALRGEEFNAVSEAAPRLMDALAEGMGVARGALKQMASDGKITSQVMADVLPQALAKLRIEAAQVQTIGGAFTVLQGKVLEFTGVTAQANGSVALLTGGINLLSSHLAEVAGALTTITAVKTVNWLQGTIAETYRKVAADQAARTATLAAAQADLARVQATGAQAAATQGAVVIARAEMVARLGQANANIVAADAAIAAATAAGAQSFALRTLRLATGELAAAETARGAALAELALLDQQQVRISAEIAVAREAEAAATRSLAAAQGGAALGAGMVGRAVGLLGGPLGAIVTVLGIAATAWAAWASSAKENSEKAAETYEEASKRINKGLDEQIARNEKLIQLQNLGMSKPEINRQLPVLEQLAAASQRLNDINTRSGEYAAGAGKSNTQVDLDRLAVMKDIVALTEKMQKAEASAKAAEAGGSALTDLIAVRQRLSGVNKQDLEDLAKLQTAHDKGAISDREYTEMFAQLSAQIWKNSEAGKAATAAAEKEQTAYAQLASAVREKIDATAQEAAGRGKLADSQKLQIALDEQQRAGKLKLSAVDRAAYEGLIRQLAGNEAIIASNKRAAAGAEAMAKIWQDYQDTAARTIENAEQEAAKNEELARTFGMTKAAIEAQELARLQEQLAQRASLGLTLDEIATLEQLIAAKKRNAVALGSLEQSEATKKAADDMAAEYKRASEQIGQSLTDELMRGGKSAAEYLQDLFRTVVLRPMLAPVGTALGNGLTSMLGMPGAAPASAGGQSSLIGAAQTASSLFSAGKTMYAGFQSGIVGSMGSAVTTMGNLFGAQAISSFGAGMSSPGAVAVMTELSQGTAAGSIAASDVAAAAGSGSMAAGASAATYAIPIAGWIAAGMMLSNSLYKQGWDANNGSVNTLGKTVNGGMFIANDILKGIGLSNSAANILAGMGPISKLFGRKNPEVESQGIEGTVSAAGFSGDRYANIVEKGGWFRSDKRYPTTAPLDTAQDAGLDATIQSMIIAVKGFGSVLGAQADQIDSYTKDVKLQLTGDAAKDNEAIAKLFGDIGDELSNKLIPNLANFAHTGETASATLQRLAGDFSATNQVAQLLGKNAADVYGSLGMDSAAARERLIDLAGGVSVLGQQAADYAQNFLTDAQRLAPVTAGVNAAMADLGLASITTRAAFKDCIDQILASGASMTDAQAKQLASMLGLEAAFALAHPDDTAKALETANSLLAIQAQMYEISGDKAGAAAVLEKQHAAALAALDPALRGATLQLWAVQKAADAISQVKADASTLLGNVDGAFTALQSVVNRQKAVAQQGIDAATASIAAHKALTDSLHGTLDSMKDLLAAKEDRLAAQAQIGAALAIAKAGGPLPAADSLKNALGVVAKDASAQFSTRTDYLRDFYHTRNDIADLAGITDSSLSVEQQSLDALNAQIKSLDGVLASAQEQIDVLKGQSTSLLSINDAVRGLATAILAAQKNPLVAATQSVNDVYQKTLGRAPDAAGLAYWQQQAAAGMSSDAILGAIAGSPEATIQGMYKTMLGHPADAAGLDFWLGQASRGVSWADISAAIAGSAEAKRLHPFAVGTNYVPEDMPALVHKGERIIQAGDNRELIRRLASPAPNNDALAADMSKVRQLLERYAPALKKIADNTEDHLKMFDQVTAGGTAILTEAA